MSCFEPLEEFVVVGLRRALHAEVVPRVAARQQKGDHVNLVPGNQVVQQTKAFEFNGCCLLKQLWGLRVLGSPGDSLARAVAIPEISTHRADDRVRVCLDEVQDVSEHFGR